MNNLIIGIAGGSGSGKTTLALRLKERFGEDEVRLISHDSYYKRHDDLPFEERCKLNYDHPDAFDNALLIYHLQELKAGRAIDCPVYDYSNHNRSDKVQHIEPAPVLIVEGILPFVEPELCAMFDYKIFVDTDADERILRRLVRDVKERGRSLDSVIEQYLTTVKPMHEAFVEPSKRNADIIVPNGGENTTAIEMLAHHIRRPDRKGKYAVIFPSKKGLPIPHRQPLLHSYEKPEFRLELRFLHLSRSVDGGTHQSTLQTGLGHLVVALVEVLLGQNLLGALFGSLGAGLVDLFRPLPGGSH